MDEAHHARIRQEAMRHRRMILHRRFAPYVWDAFTHTPFYLHWQHLLSLLRRFRTVAFLFRVLTVMLTILQTGALVILTTALFLVILPIAVLCTVGILIAAFFSARRSNEALRLPVANRKVYVLFMTENENPFLAQNAKSLAADDGCVIIVSPYWISRKGLCRGRLYTTFREEFPRVFLVRKYYFFSLRKKVLNSSKTAYLY